MIESGIRSKVLANATVSGLIGTRLYPGVLPQAATHPAATYNRVPGKSAHHLAGPSALKNARLQFDCLSTVSYTQARAVAEAIHSVMERLKGSVTGGYIKSVFPVDDGTDMSTPELEQWREKLEYSIWYTEAT